MAWRVMNSLLILREQVNLAAPNRSKGADGTICDTAHPTTSDHCPHFVRDVGPEMVTALDLTHDPAGGFDSYAFAEVLRTHRDPRIKYVISNRRIFDSSGPDAWTWRPYTGTSDPHTGHVHISVLDAPISDTRTPWNLGGSTTMADSPTTYYTGAYMESGVIGLQDPVIIKATTSTDPDAVGATVPNQLAKSLSIIRTDLTAIRAEQLAQKAMLVSMDAKLDLILEKLNQGGGGTTFPATSTFTSNGTGTITWFPVE